MKGGNSHTAYLTPDQLRAGKRFKAAAISFFDGMTEHDAALLKHVSQNARDQQSDVLVIMCAYDRKVSTAATLPTVLLSPEERWHMLSEAGYRNIFPVTITPDPHSAKQIQWPADPSFLLQHADTLTPGADIWEAPEFKGFLKKMVHHAKEQHWNLDKTFQKYPMKDRDGLKDHIANGQVAQFRKRLGYAFPLGGYVVKGNMIGHTLGYPTANLRVADHMKVLPGQGVYVGMVKVAGQWYQAMVNIGIRPTLDMENVTIEAHLFDFNEDIYGEWISISFLERIRDEMRFNSLSELKLQLDKDSRTAREVLEKCLENSSADEFIRCPGIRSS